jgi:uncharacterized membrane protein YsdA (DUF1294 family)
MYGMMVGAYMHEYEHKREHERFKYLMSFGFVCVSTRSSAYAFSKFKL